MGSGIAAHFANAGLEVLLLDIVPPNLSAGAPGEKNKAKRDAFAVGGLEKALKSRPAAFFHKDNARLVTTGVKPGPTVIKIDGEPGTQHKWNVTDPERDGLVTFLRGLPPRGFQ